MAITAEEIKALRLGLGRNQASMAAIVGVSAMTIGRWERGDTKPMRVFEERLRKLESYVGQQSLVEAAK